MVVARIKEHLRQFFNEHLSQNGDVMTMTLTALSCEIEALRHRRNGRRGDGCVELKRGEHYGIG